MSTHLGLITDRIAKFSIIFGIAFLLVGLALSLVLVPGEAAEVNGQGNCESGWVYKDESSPFGYNGSETITKVIVKSGLGCFPLTISSPSNGCYQATGLGTTSVSVTRIGTPGPDCQEISHAPRVSGFMHFRWSDNKPVARRDTTANSQAPSSMLVLPPRNHQQRPNLLHHRATSHNGATGNHGTTCYHRATSHNGGTGYHGTTCYHRATSHNGGQPLIFVEPGMLGLHDNQLTWSYHGTTRHNRATGYHGTTRHN